MKRNITNGTHAHIGENQNAYKEEVKQGWKNLSYKANARVYDAKSGHGPHSPSPGAAASPKRLEKKVAYLQFATEPVWTQNPDSQPTKIYPSHN
jgi:hypothetical protein